YLDPTRTPIPRLLEDGFYHRHLMNFLGLFPAQQLLVLLYDDIRARPAEVFRQVCGHLGIDDTIAPQAVGNRVKDKDVPVVPPSARRMLAPLKPLVAPWRQTGLFGALRSLVARRLHYPPLTPELRERLAGHYAEDVARLSELLGRDLSVWLANNDTAGEASPLRVGHSTRELPQAQRPCAPLRRQCAGDGGRPAARTGWDHLGGAALVPDRPGERHARRDQPEGIQHDVRDARADHADHGQQRQQREVEAQGRDDH